MESQHLSTSDGTQLHVYTERSVGTCRGQILLVHGASEHGGRYEHLMHTFAEAGFFSVTPDLRGHGQSPGPRGHVTDYQRFLDDVDLLLRHMTMQSPHLPVFLYGHSMGGGIVANWLVTRSHPAVRAAILSAPWLLLANDPPAWKVRVYRWAARVLPAFTVPVKPPIDQLTHDVAVAHRYHDDPLIHHRISLRLAVQAYDAGQATLSAAQTCPIPVLLMHSPDDRITCATGSQRFADTAPFAEIQLYPGFAHELHNDTQWHEVSESVLHWLERHCAPVGAEQVK
ncbi:MAG: lysophospholipase [Planctomycetaceae bacterium]|nr:lysophospholipase [Planctomycetaceae bacterium]